MRVITLSETAFKEHCRLLEQKVRESGIAFDAIVAIARGGVYVADELRLSHEMRYFTVCSQRNTTPYKKKMMAWLLRCLPEGINNRFRMLEARILGWLRPKSGDVALKEIELPYELECYLNGGCRSILVVDDAVDSGRTMLSVVKALSGISADIRVMTAVVTVTVANPMIGADFCIYNDGTLIRFPWSMDFGRDGKQSCHR